MFYSTFHIWPENIVEAVQVKQEVAAFSSSHRIELKKKSLRFIRQEEDGLALPPGSHPANQSGLFCLYVFGEQSQNLVAGLQQLATTC